MSATEALDVPTPGQAAELYRQHGRTVRAFLASRVRDPGAVEDLVQETFLAAFARGVPPGEEGRWLFGIARNKVQKYMRDRGETAIAEPTVASLEAGPAERLGDAEEREQVRKAMGSLDEELREVVLLRYEGGLDYQAIADRLEVPVSTIQGRLKRARLALRDLLTPRDREGRRA